jgi:hypothetical protein
LLELKPPACIEIVYEILVIFLPDGIADPLAVAFRPLVPALSYPKVPLYVIDAINDTSFSYPLHFNAYPVDVVIQSKYPLSSVPTDIFCVTRASVMCSLLLLI